MLTMFGRIAVILLIALALVPVRSGATEASAPLAGALAKPPATALEQLRGDAKIALRNRLGFDVPIRLDPASQPGAPVFTATYELARDDVAPSLGLSAADLNGPFALQQSSWNCDWNPCDIWGVAAQPFAPNWKWVDRINVCTGTVTLWIYAAPALYTVASAGVVGNVPQLIYGDLAGGTWCSTTPPPPVIGGCPPGIAVGAHAFTEGAPAAYYAGADNLNPGTGFIEGQAFTPVNPLGGSGWGPLPYVAAESDMVFDHSGAAHPLIAEVNMGPAWALARVSRANGTQYRLAPPAGRGVNYYGLAFDGFGRLWGTKPNAGPNVVWDLDLISLATGTGVTIHSNLPPWITDLASTPACGGPSTDEQGDLGDAPDSSNHFGVSMTAYAAVMAQFPSVFDSATGLPPGPFHRLSGDSWLGTSISQEADADALPDQDTLTNVDPPTNAPDRDGFDDGVTIPLNLPQCQLTQFQYTMNVAGPQMTRYTNVWFDFNRNGIWGDQIQCTYQGQPYTVSEWAVQDQITSLGPGMHVVTTPSLRSLDNQSSLWMRITLSETNAPGPDGSGYVGGYEIGETEDRLLNWIGNTQYQ